MHTMDMTEGNAQVELAQNLSKTRKKNTRKLKSGLNIPNMRNHQEKLPSIAGGKRPKFV